MTAGYPTSAKAAAVSPTQSIAIVRGYGIPSSAAAARVCFLSFAASSAASDASARPMPCCSKHERHDRSAATEPSIDGMTTRAGSAQARSITAWAYAAGSSW